MPKVKRASSTGEENFENSTMDDVKMEDGVRPSKKRGKSKKVKLMSASGQDDADRRVLRRKQRELQADIATDGGGEGEEGGDRIGRLRDANNELWDDVRFTREAVLDADNVNSLAAKATREAEKLVQVPRYDAVRLAQAFTKKGSVGGQFNWTDLGFQAGVCFSSLPSNAWFLYGPLDSEYKPKERKKAERRKRQTADDDEVELENPDDVEQKDKKKCDGNELSAVEKHISVIRKTVDKVCRKANDDAKERVDSFKESIGEEEDERTAKKLVKRYLKEQSHISAVNALFNPRSFTQTVENVFHFSFLVKEGAASIHARGTDVAAKYDAEPGPVLCKANAPSPETGANKQNTQAVIRLNMRDWRDMVNAYKVEESHIPHRENGKVAGKKSKKKRKSADMS